MSEHEPFLARWSRRKQEAAEREDAARAPKPEGVASSDAERKDVPSAAPAAGRGEACEPKTPAFDPASLPPIESISAETNIRAFLAEGVPAELRRAALRRVWVSDPAIRDFVGLQENDWDFTNPESIPGFGKLAADFDVDAMVRGVFGDAPEASTAETPTGPVSEDKPAIPTQAHEVSHDPASHASEAAQDEGSEESASPNAGEPAARVDANPEGQSAIVRREDGAATQKDVTQSHGHPARPRRPHGGAMPRDFPDV